MFRYAVIGIGILWASLMFISWGEADTVHTPQQQPENQTPSVSLSRQG